MKIGFLGFGVFGEAISSLVSLNGYKFESVDQGQHFTQSPDIVFCAVPVQKMCQALMEHKASLSGSLVVNLSKGIEKETHKLPYEIVTSVLGEVDYATIAGPSFADEIKNKVPTTVSVAGSNPVVVSKVTKVISTPFFVLEELGTILELELAAAMKNIYAIATGYLYGSTGGQNTQAHLQVVALREYLSLLEQLEGGVEVVRPGVVGDLFLTTGSTNSRNFQYGEAIAKGVVRDDLTVEGAASAVAIMGLCEKNKVDLPLVKAVVEIIGKGQSAKENFYRALGFVNLSENLL